MFDALSIGATGMQAQQLQVETIANNLANVNTAGFKKSRVQFADLVVRGSQALASGDANSPLASAQGLGAGVAVAAASRLFDAGEVRVTGSAWDVAIQGDGFLEIAMPDGSRAFTRGGTFKVNRDGLLATLSGVPLKPGISIPEGAQALTIAADGRVQARLPGQDTPVELGQLELARFANSQGLLAQADGIYRATQASGEPMTARPGEDGTGRLAQGALESSNVKMVEEMVSLMVAQRAYEASAKVVQAADEMMGMVNGLRK